MNSFLEAPGTIEATAARWLHDLTNKVNAVLVVKLSLDGPSGRLKPGAPADLVFEKQRADAFEASGRQRPRSSA